MVTETEIEISFCIQKLLVWVKGTLRTLKTLLGDLFKNPEKVMKMR